jgi:hypothetical protein
MGNAASKDWRRVARDPKFAFQEMSSLLFIGGVVLAGLFPWPWFWLLQMNGEGPLLAAAKYWVVLLPVSLTATGFRAWWMAAWRCGAGLRVVLVVGGQRRARVQVRRGMAMTLAKVVTASLTQGQDAGRRRCRRRAPVVRRAGTCRNRYRSAFGSHAFNLGQGEQP